MRRLWWWLVRRYWPPLGTHVWVNSVTQQGYSLIVSPVPLPAFRGLNGRLFSGSCVVGGTLWVSVHNRHRRTVRITGCVSVTDYRRSRVLDLGDLTLRPGRSGLIGCEVPEGHSLSRILMDAGSPSGAGAEPQ